MKKTVSVFLVCVLAVCAFNQILGVWAFAVIAMLSGAALGALWAQGLFAAEERGWRYDQRLVRRPNA